MNAGHSFTEILSLVRPRKSAKGVWRKPKLSARQAKVAVAKLRLAGEQVDNKALRLAMGRSETKLVHWKTNKGRKSTRMRMQRLQTIEKKLKEIPKVWATYKVQKTRERIRLSKKYKGFGLLSTPPVSTIGKTAKSAQLNEISLEKDLQRVARNKHLTFLPPHLQAELDALKEAKKQKEEEEKNQKAKKKK